MVLLSNNLYNISFCHFNTLNNNKLFIPLTSIKEMRKFSIKKSGLILEEPIIKSKTNKNQIQLENQQSSLNEKISLHAVQKHLSILKLEEALIILTLITTAVLGRILLQPLPSVEPITFIALIAGSLFGIRKGALVGASSWYLSNFFMFGGQGPWTLIHIGSGIVAGTLGGLMLKKPTIIKSMIAITIATIIFELSINIMSGLIFFGILTSFITAIPFALTHLTSNIIFSTILPKSRTTILKKGKLDEMTMCKQFIKKLKQKRAKTNEL